LIGVKTSKNYKFLAFSCRWTQDKTQLLGLIEKITPYIFAISFLEEAVGNQLFLPHVVTIIGSTRSTWETTKEELLKPSKR